MRVRYAAPAAADLDGILTYVAERSPGGAARLADRLESLIAGLADFPELGARTDEPGVRRLVVTPFPYLVFYEIARDEVLILAVRHSARAEIASSRDAARGSSG